MNKLVPGQRDENGDIWFARSLADLDKLTQKTLECGSELSSDHPGFNDQDYRQRRRKIVELALAYKQ